MKRRSLLRFVLCVVLPLSALRTHLAGAESAKPAEPTTPTAGARSPAAATKDEPFVNSLGMKFVPVPGTAVLFSIWETRVGDFKVFAQEKGHNAGELHSLDTDGSNRRGHTWRDPGPGFTQTDLHPVVGVNCDDALAFCTWLTLRERKEGRISEAQFYRLPKDLEWSAAVGLPPEPGAAPKDRTGVIKDVYPWGGSFPPPDGAGNYAGRESKIGKEPSYWTFIKTLSDGAPRTSPVGTYPANGGGIYDLGGNVAEWSEDFYDGESGGRVLRGASWYDDEPAKMLSSFRDGDSPGVRHSHIGFRVVLVGASPP